MRADWPGESVSRIPNWLYTDPEVYAREQARIFGGRSWCYVGLGVEVPGPGDFKRSFVGERPVILVRDDAGALRVLENRCAHRGLQLCLRPHGRVRELVCPYHQWTYDLTGRLVGVPFRRGVKGQGGMPPEFQLEAHALGSLAVAERHGVVFASFDAGTEPLADYLGPAMLPYFDRVFDGRELRLLGYSRQLVPANWKLMFENIKDPYHASLLHVFLVSFGLFRADQPSAVKMDATGRHACLISRRGIGPAAADVADLRSLRSDLVLEDPRLLDPVREFSGDDTVVMQTVWPSLIVQQQSNTLALRQLVPQGAGAFRLDWTFFGYAADDEAMTLRRLRQANLMGPAGFVSADDSEVMKLGQDGVAPYPETAGVLEMGGHGTGDEPHMVTEAAVRAFYAHYRRVMEL